MFKIIQVNCIIYYIVCKNTHLLVNEDGFKSWWFKVILITLSCINIDFFSPLGDRSDVLNSICCDEVFGCFEPHQWRVSLLRNFWPPSFFIRIFEFMLYNKILIIRWKYLWYRWISVTKNFCFFLVLTCLDTETLESCITF